MEFESIGEIAYFYTLGRKLEWLNRESGKWEDSKAESLDEVMFNMIKCGSAYRVKCL